VVVVPDTRCQTLQPQTFLVTTLFPTEAQRASKIRPRYPNRKYRTGSAGVDIKGGFIYNFGMKTILVVDDVAANLTLMRGILKSSYELCLAKNTDNAFAAMERTAIDLILLDIAMPGMNGFEFLAILKKNPLFAKIPVILITGSASLDFSEQEQSADVAAFIQKPIDAASLIRKVTEILE
jgi:CheY-like chemotaxis protein